MAIIDHAAVREASAPLTPTTAARTGGFARVVARPARISVWRADLPFLLSLAALLLVVTTAPYAWAYASAPADRQFMGITFTTHDYSQYMSWARESRDRVFVENKLTPEPGPATFFNPVWWLVGRIEAWTGWSFAAINQGFRVLAGMTFVLVLGAFTGLVLPGRERRVAVALACVTSGFGWVLVLAKQVLGELPLPLLVHGFPGNSFFGIMVVPHMILSASMLIGSLGLMLDAYRRQCGRRALLAGLLCCGLGFAHPYNIVTAYSVVGTFGVVTVLRDGWRWRWIMMLAAFYGLSAPSVLYWMWVSAGSAEWRQVLEQYRNLGVFTPQPAQLLIYLGVPAIVAALTFRGFVPLRLRSVEELFVTGWLAVNALIIYLPFNFQINLLSGIQVPLAILTTIGLYRHVMPWLRETLPGRLAGLVRFTPLAIVLLVLPTNLYLFSWRIVDLNRHTYPDYLHRDDVSALRWLEANAAPSDVVLSSLSIGHYVPGYTGAHAFLGHGANTLDFFGKREMVNRFFAAGSDDAERQRTLARYHVRFVFLGPAERAIGAFDPRRAAYLEPAYVQAETTVYRVRQATAAATGQ
ncbi:MAG: hypothetical protein IT306_11870 [Chloroflexi bacterium]|nr:hypothetical protein [Chloroflexota bacterium]